MYVQSYNDQRIIRLVQVQRKNGTEIENGNQNRRMNGNTSMSGLNISLP